MRNKFFLIVLFTFVLSSFVIANDIGAGIMIGEPTGLSFSLNNQFILGTAWSFREYVHIHGDYIFFRSGIKKIEDEIAKPFGWYLGGGAKLRIFTKDKDTDDSAVGLGIRIPVGVTFYPGPKIELFLELAPGISLFPDTEGDLDGGIGIRYHF